MVKIGERWHCAGEYLERCIGGEKLVDLVVRGNTTYYIFESGHELPLLCACCSEPLIVPNVEKTRRQMRGCRLKSATLAVAVTNDGEERLKFALKFSGKGLLWWATMPPVTISPQAVVRMRRPDECPRPEKRK
jgi:hypothetical protein